MMIKTMIGISILFFIATLIAIKKYTEKSETYKEYYNRSKTWIIWLYAITIILTIGTSITSGLMNPEEKIVNIVLFIFCICIGITLICIAQFQMFNNYNQGYIEYIKVITNIKKSTEIEIQEEKIESLEIINMVKGLPKKIVTLKYVDEDGKKQTQEFPKGSKENCIKELYETTK